MKSSWAPTWPPNSGSRKPTSWTCWARLFSVTAVLPQTGTVDDSRIFAHLHVVQDLSKKGPVINAIEVVGCCQEISKGLVEKINRLLPDAKVVTIAQIADAQIKINHMMSNLSLMFLVIIIFVGGASIANYMYANVYERRREIGTLMALGAIWPGAADLPAQGPDPWLGRRDRRLRAGHHPGRDSRPEAGWRRRPADALTGPLAVGISVALALAASFFPAGVPPGLTLVPRSRRSDPC